MTEAQREARRQAAKRYRAAHPDRVRENYRASRDRRSEQIKARRRARYAADPQKYCAAQKRLREKHPDKVKAHNLKKYGGMTLAVFEQMRSDQAGCCAICREEFTAAPHVDHCHKTGVVRSLLCGGCNHGLGKFKDSPARLEAAAEYVRRHIKPRLTLMKSGTND
ncbi:MAG TPA: endonuclease VII domain-containing protein [Reyranella sp.]|nr:endonuclease VII domain-containing protein [Reyranella sp.]